MAAEMSETRPLSLDPGGPPAVQPRGRVCPRCSYERKLADTAPAWQCPRCEVAYDKASRSPSAQDRARERQERQQRQAGAARHSRAVAVVCLALAVAGAALWGFQRWRAAHPSAQERAAAAAADARKSQVTAAQAELEVQADLKAAAEHLNMARTEQALAILDRHVARNNPAAMVQLAIVYRSGYRVPQDLPRAMELLRKAAAEGYAPAFVNLGFAAETGQGQPQNWDEAVNQYGKAARQGDPAGLYSLGVIRARGVPGHPPEPLVAHFLLDLADRASRSGNTGDGYAPNNRSAFWATGELRKLAETMSPADVAKARAWADEWKPGQPLPG